MRQIKFRAWDKVTSSMLSWDDLGLRCNASRGISCLQHEDEQRIPTQYTGLRDKNGVEIYEGDILASDPLYDGFQTFSTIEMGLSPVDGNEYGWHWRNGPPVRPVDMVDERYSVIGNIYENPELLEANQ